MKRQSILLKIIIPVITILFISLVSFSIITYIKMGATLRSQMQQLTSSNLDSMVNTIKENEASYDLVKKQVYNDTTVKCRAIAEIAKVSPTLLSNNYMLDIAKKFGVDEVHIVDKNGSIQYSSVPEFVGFDMNSSEQSKVFMEAATNKNFFLVQEPSARGTDGTLFQYAGVPRLDAPGVVQVGLKPETLRKLLESTSIDKLIHSTKFGKTGTAMVTDLKGVVTSHKDSGIVGKNLSDLGIKVDLTKESGELLYSYKGEDNYLRYVKVGGSFLYTMVKQSEFMTPLYETLKTVVIVEIIVFILGMIIVTFVSRLITKPIINLVGAADRLAACDLTATIDVTKKDEVGVLAESFQTMADNINEVMNQINSASVRVASGARQVSDSSIALSQGATEQASSVQELSASLEEVSSQTRLNAEKANQANALAEAAKLNAVQGNAQMDEMLNAMAEINDASSNISKIIKVIDEIAFQTNILALNAAVEAARAGQHGKGFAVVAEEVRNLAARSASAAKETTDMIEGSIRKVEGGTKIANETASALNHIVEDITKVSGLVNDISVAPSEQANGVDQINQGIFQVSQVVQTNSATSEESAAASEVLSQQAHVLQELVGKFKLKAIEVSKDKFEDLSPELLNMLKSMAEQEKKSKGLTDWSHETDAVHKPTTAVSDKTLGKY